MAKMATITIRINEDIKRTAEEICDELGISLSTAVVMLLKKMSREKRIPFEVSIDPSIVMIRVAATATSTS